MVRCSLLVVPEPTSRFDSDLPMPLRRDFVLGSVVGLLLALDESGHSSTNDRSSIGKRIVLCNIIDMVNISSFASRYYCGEVDCIGGES